ncbi:MAG TPA: LysR family transcriptional regulator [Rickettsiales bacterium]|nr:LysR family transcriptional regulator [Rickettsiales bacterium]
MKESKENIINEMNTEDINIHYRSHRFSQIRAFCSVVQSNYSLVEASEKIHLARSAISKQISTLEEALGIELFDRSEYGKLKPTNITDMFYKTAVGYVNGINNILETFNKNLEEYRNTNLRIASFDIIIEKMLPFLVEFKEKNPEIKLSLYNITKSEAFKKLSNNELDFAIYPTDETGNVPADLESEKIIRNISYLVLYKGHPLENKKPNELTKQDILKYPLGLFPITSDELYSEAFANFTKEKNIISPLNIKFASMNLNKELVRRKICITFLDKIWLTKKDKKYFKLISDEFIFPKMYFYLFIRKNTKLNPIVEEILNIIRENKEKIFCYK